MSKLFLISMLLFPFCIGAQDSSIYVSDAGNFNNPPWQIMKYDMNGQNPEIFIFENLAWPQDILFREELNEVLISNLNSGIITRYDSENGGYLGDFITGLSGPTRMKIGPDSLLYILQWNGTGKVRRYDLSGNFVDDFTSIGVPQSIGLDWDADTNLYVSSYNGDLVRKFDVNGVDQGVFVSSNLQGPTNIWFDQNGELLVSDYDGTNIERFDASGNYLGIFASGLSQSEGIAIKADQSLLIGNGATASVKHFDSNGNYLGDLIPSGSGGLIRPNAVVIRDESNLNVESFLNLPVFISEMAPKQFAITVDSQDTFELQVVSVTGEIVHQVNFKVETRWNASEVAVGTYFFVFSQDGNRRLTKKAEVK